MKPFNKGQKNDHQDTEATAEAALRPNLKTVSEKPQEQLDPQALHRVRPSNTQTWRPIVPNGTRIRAPKSIVFGKRAMKSTTPERFGIKCSMRRSLLRAALWLD